MTNLKKSLGQKIKEIRKNLNMTQEQLAELVDIETPSMSNIETGKFAPSIETLEKLSVALNVKPFEFYLFYDISQDEMIEKMLKEMIKNEKLTKMMYKFFESIYLDL